MLCDAYNNIWAGSCWFFFEMFVMLFLLIFQFYLCDGNIFFIRIIPIYILFRSYYMVIQRDVQKFQRHIFCRRSCLRSCAETLGNVMIYPKMEIIQIGRKPCCNIYFTSPWVRRVYRYMCGLVHLVHHEAVQRLIRTVHLFCCHCHCSAKINFGMANHILATFCADLLGKFQLWE